MRNHDVTIAEIYANRYAYHHLRAKGWPALAAFKADRLSLAYNKLHGPFVDEDRVRIRVEVDNDCDPMDCDTFDETINADCPGGVRAIRAEKKAEIRRINRDDVWGFIAEYRDDKGTWHECWSCWGFVGEDFYFSGYDIDAMQSCVDAIKAIDDARAFLGFEEREECLCP
jgi:hypothetical protein